MNGVVYPRTHKQPPVFITRGREGEIETKMFYLAKQGKHEGSNRLLEM